MDSRLRRCRSVLRAHVRPSTLRAQGLLPPCDLPLEIETLEVPEGGIWPFLNRLQNRRIRIGS